MSNGHAVLNSPVDYFELGQRLGVRVLPQSKVRSAADLRATARDFGSHSYEAGGVCNARPGWRYFRPAWRFAGGYCANQSEYPDGDVSACLSIPMRTAHGVSRVLKTCMPKLVVILPAHLWK